MIRTIALRPLVAPLAARLAVPAVLLALFATLPATAATLPEALQAADQRTGVVTARLDLGDAERSLERTLADPSALRLERLQARQGVELATAQLRAARFEAYTDIASAYVQVLEAEAGRALAEDAADLAQRGLDIARIRLERGAGTELDVRDAETELASARSDLASARQGEALARRSFASLTGLDADDLAPVPAELLTTELPSENVLYGRLDQAPTLLQASHGVALARTARELLDPAYAPARDIEAAELSVTQASEGLSEARRGLELQLRSLIDRVAAARDGLAVARDALDNARDRDDVDRSRLDAGLIAEITYQQTRLATAQARLSAMQAEHELLLALLRLQSDTGVPLEGVDGF